MTKIELVKIVAQKTGIDQATVLVAVEGMVETIKECLHTWMGNMDTQASRTEDCTQYIQEYHNGY